MLAMAKIGFAETTHTRTTAVNDAVRTSDRGAVMSISLQHVKMVNTFGTASNYSARLCAAGLFLLFG